MIIVVLIYLRRTDNTIPKTTIAERKPITIPIHNTRKTPTINSKHIHLRFTESNKVKQYLVL